LSIPKDVKLFDRLVAAGEQITRLLDAGCDAAGVINGVLGTDRAREVGALKRSDGKQVRPGDLKVAVAYWGGGKGRWKPRPYMAEELPAFDYGDAWGVLPDKSVHAGLLKPLGKAFQRILARRHRDARP
jgi:hypothetical protein